MITPKPCPFCGCDPYPATTTLLADGRYLWRVGCTEEDCWFNPQIVAFSHDEAWRRWNERAREPKPSDLELAGQGGMK